MPRPVGLVEQAMEAQATIRETTRRIAPLYTAALATGDYGVMAEAHALARTLRAAQTQAHRIAGMGERIACPDGRVGLWHGRAA